MWNQEVQFLVEDPEKQVCVCVIVWYCWAVCLRAAWNGER